MPRPDGGPHRTGDPQTPRQARVAPRQARVCQAPRAPGAPAPRRLQAHAPDRPRQAHDGQRLRGTGRRDGPGRPACRRLLLARRQRAAVPSHASGDDERGRVLDRQGAGRAVSTASRPSIPGNGTTEPASSSTVKLIVPAKIAMSISPRVVPWSGKITITGRLVGGWVPGDGVALRLRVPYPGGQILQEPFRTDRHGRFKFRWTYRSGRGVVQLPLRGRNHLDRIGLPVGGRDEQPRRRHLRAPDATDPPTSTAPPRERTMSTRARGEHDWPRTTGLAGRCGRRSAVLS